MKRINIIILGILILVGACTDKFEDINTQKTAIIHANPINLFVNLCGAPIANYQRNINLYPDLYAQYWANTVNGFRSPRYEYVDGWIGNQWKEHYTQYNRLYLAIVQEAGDNANLTNEVAIADIFICYRWAVMTDTYGDIPYTGAGEGAAVKYNAQKDIYYDLIARLTNDVATLKADPNQATYSNYDLIYKGDVAKWKKFANSLRLRLAMRMSNVDKTKAQTEAAAAIAAGVMDSNDDVAKLPLDPNGWYDYLHQMAVNWGNVRISETFTNYLNNQSSTLDPRAPFWLTPSLNGKYEGVKNGYINPTASDLAWEKKSTMNTSSGYKDFKLSTLAVPIMFYSEVCFLKAEAALRGWTAGDANTLYKEAIKASMNYVGVASADADSYIATLPDLSAGTNEAKLKQLITQKWIANFPNGVEAWADFRRTDYPDLTLPVDGVSGNASVAQGKFVKRVRYPDNQHEMNEVSMPESLNTLDKDRMDVKVWWDAAGDGTYSNF